MKLPEGKVKATAVNPKSLIVYSQPKMGKTTLLAQLEDSLLIDLEKGAKYLDAVKVEANNYDELVEIVRALKEANKENGGYKYKYGIIDTVSRLEEFVHPLAVKLYQKTPMGKKFPSTGDILALPNGAGYGYLRQAMNKMANVFAELFDTVIYIGHLKEKIVEKDDKEVTSKDLALTGKLATIFAANVDAMGYLYRDRKGHMYLSFKASDELASGARPEHLRGQNIQVAEKQEDGTIKYYWDRIFLKE